MIVFASGASGKKHHRSCQDRAFATLARNGITATFALALGLSFSSLSCSSSSSNQQIDDYDTVSILEILITGAISSSSWNKVGAVNASGTCTGGGTYTVAGNISSGPPYTYDLNFAFSQCTSAADGTQKFTYAGLVHYIDSGVGGASPVQTFESNSLTISGDDGTGALSGYQNCAVDAQVSGINISGTICSRGIVNEAANAGATNSGSGSTPATGTGSSSTSGSSCPCQATDAPSYAACANDADEAACSCAAAYLDNCALQHVPGCCAAGASTTACTSHLQSDCQSQLSTAASYASGGAAPECTSATFACQ